MLLLIYLSYAILQKMEIISFGLLRLLTQDHNDFSHLKDVNRIMKNKDFAFYVSMHVYVCIYIYIHPSRHPSDLFGGLCIFWLVSKQHVP